MVSDFFISIEIDFVFLLSNQLSMKINHLQIEIDGIDKEILRDLMDDARKPILQIAAEEELRISQKPLKKFVKTKCIWAKFL